MSNGLHPTNISFLPTGANGVVQVSSVILGRDITGAGGDIGFGAGGRADYAQLVQINLTHRAGGGTLTKECSINFNANDVAAIAGLPTNLNLTLKEVTVCELGVTKKMVILGSQTYT